MYSKEREQPIKYESQLLKLMIEMLDELERGEDFYHQETEREKMLKECVEEIKDVFFRNIP